MDIMQIVVAGSLVVVGLTTLGYAGRISRILGSNTGPIYSSCNLNLKHHSSCSNGSCSAISWVQECFLSGG